jgi:hypothetical protein
MDRDGSTAYDLHILSKSGLRLSFGSFWGPRDSSYPHFHSAGWITTRGGSFNDWCLPR